jgi:hypothetical protein
MLRPEISARNMEKIFYAMPNKDAPAHLDPTVKDLLSPLFNVDFSRLELVGDLGEFTAQLDKEWTAVRAR